MRKWNDTEVWQEVSTRREVVSQWKTRMKYGE